MSKVTDAIRAHKATLEKRPFEIPEWGVSGLIYPLTVEDRNQQIKTAQDNLYLSFLDVICAACRDENGRQIFDAQDKLALRKEADPRIVERIALQIITPYNEADTQGETGAGDGVTH